MSNNFTRAVALLLVCTVFSGLCSCKKQIDQPKPETETFVTDITIPGGSFAVAYAADDSLNPFFWSTVVNSSLTSLLFRSLYYIDSDFTAKNDLSLSESLAGLTLTVSIKADQTFSDGSPFTAEDIVYSFDAAKKSRLYKERLSGIKNSRAVDDTTVAFELSYPDINALNALTFPIVKKGTAENEADLPIGNGYYKFTQDGIRLSLTCNLLYDGVLPQVGTIRLSDTGNATSLSHLVDTGEIDFCYSDLADETAEKTYSAVTYVYLNNLVYLGVNSNSVNLVLAELRCAVSAAIDRTAIAENAFCRFARASAIPFNTAWRETVASKQAGAAALVSEPEKAVMTLEKYGFTQEHPLVITLLCPDTNSFMRSAAALLTEQLSKCGITLKTVYATDDKYKKLIEAGEYDLYFGEIKIPVTMDLSGFFSPNGAVAFGISHENITCDELYFDFREKKTDIDTFLSAFLSEMPFIPLCYRNGRFCYTRSIVTPVEVTENRIFGDIALWQLGDS